MDSYIEITKVVKERVPILREATYDEIKQIKNDEMFDTEKLIDWDNAETVEEDYSFGGIRLVLNGKAIYQKIGRYL